MQEIQFLGWSSLPQASPNYIICMHFIRIRTVVGIALIKHKVALGINHQENYFRWTLQEYVKGISIQMQRECHQQEIYNRQTIYKFVNCSVDTVRTPKLMYLGHSN